LRDRPNTGTPLKVALLGYGFAGKTFHAPLLARVPGLRLTHVVSSDSAKVRKDWDVTVLAKPEDAFALPEIDLIVIATPNPTHFELARKALGSDKHVVVDKPFTNTVAEAAELVSLASSRGRLLSVFQSRRWDADFLTLRQLLADGALGKVALLHVLLRYDRSRVILHGASLVVAETPRFTVHGALGSYTKFGMDTQEDSLKRGDVPGSPGWGHDPQMGTLIAKRNAGFETLQVPNIPGNYLAFYEGIRDAITVGAPIPVTPEDGLAVINVLETAVKSSTARAEMPFNQVKW
jgi:predicted dehydrogenase